MSDGVVQGNLWNGREWGKSYGLCYLRDLAYMKSEIHYCFFLFTFIPMRLDITKVLFIHQLMHQ